MDPEHHTNLGRPGEPYTFPFLKNISLINVACEDRAALWHFVRVTHNASQITITGRTPIYSENETLPLIDNLLEEEGFWPNLHTLTCVIDIEHFKNTAVFLSIARCWDRYKRRLTLTILTAQLKQWKELAPPHATYEMVSAFCTIEELTWSNDHCHLAHPLDNHLDFCDYKSYPFRTVMFEP